MTNIISVGSPRGPYNSSCGYCSSFGSSYKTASLQASQLSCEVYQKMIDRGWRRSGSYCYKPDLRRSCCPQYTIKLDALQFKPSKSQRKLINRWNRFVLDGEESVMRTDHQKGTPKSLSPSQTPTFSLTSSIHASELDFLGENEAVHRFQVSLEPSIYTPEKFGLYERYQSQIHGDDENSPLQFARFLVRSPLQGEPIPYSSAPPLHLPVQYGSYHQMYRLDDQLIAMAVLDILPNCVSSVYFMYDDTWNKYSFGKLSALREVSLAREMHEAGAPGMAWLYMGFYIHSCQKMRYKGDYSPSFLADPETYCWFPLEACTPLLDKYRYACFSNPEHSIEDVVDSDGGALGVPDIRISNRDLKEIFAFQARMKGKLSVIPVAMSMRWSSDEKSRDILSCIYCLGMELSKSIILDY